MEQLPNEILKRLDTLAQKLGITIDHLWWVLTAQAYVESVKGMIALLIAGMITYVCYRLVLITNRAIDQSNHNDFPVALLAVVLAILGGALFVYGFDRSFYFLNPEYFALGRVLSIFGK